MLAAVMAQPQNNQTLRFAVGRAVGHEAFALERPQPRIEIVTLGRISMARFFPNVKISAVHGQARSVGGRLVVAMFHPAAALHQQSLRQTLIDDFKKLPGLIAKSKKESPSQAGGDDKADEGPASQLSLF